MIGVHIHEPEIDCLTCDYIVNNFNDYSSAEDSTVFIEYQKKDVLNSYNTSVKDLNLFLSKKIEPHPSLFNFRLNKNFTKIH